MNKVEPIEALQIFHFAPLPPKTEREQHYAEYPLSPHIRLDPLASAVVVFQRRPHYKDCSFVR